MSKKKNDKKTGRRKKQIKNYEKYLLKKIELKTKIK